MKKVAKKWEIWKEKEKVAKSEEEAKKLVIEQFQSRLKSLTKNRAKECPQEKSGIMKLS